MKKKLWLLYALITTISWGVWGAFIEIPEKAGFPATMGYIVWALTMVPCAIVALMVIKWKLETDLRSILLGSTIGFLGAGGQLIIISGIKRRTSLYCFSFHITVPCVNHYPVSCFFEGEDRKKAMG